MILSMLGMMARLPARQHGHHLNEAQDESTHDQGDEEEGPEQRVAGVLGGHGTPT